jgi:hypothetical protein
MSEFVLIAFLDSNLVTSTACIETDKAEFTGGVPEIVDGIFAAWDGALESQGDTVQFATQNAHAPNEVVDVEDVLLVKLRSQDNEGAPRTATLANQTVG